MKFISDILELKVALISSNTGCVRFKVELENKLTDRLHNTYHEKWTMHVDKFENYIK